MKVFYNVVQFPNGYYAVRKTQKMLFAPPIVKYYDFKTNKGLWFNESSVFFRDCQTPYKEFALYVYDIVKNSKKDDDCVKIIK